MIDTAELRRWADYSLITENLMAKASWLIVTEYLHDAADELDRLRAENERLRGGWQAVRDDGPERTLMVKA